MACSVGKGTYSNGRLFFLLPFSLSSNTLNSDISETACRACMKFKMPSYLPMRRTVKEIFFSPPLGTSPGEKNLRNIVSRWSRELPISLFPNLVRWGSVCPYYTVFNKIPDISKHGGVGGGKKNFEIGVFLFSDIFHFSDRLFFRVFFWLRKS